MDQEEYSRRYESLLDKNKSNFPENFLCEHCGETLK
jgi:hypothetical protein